MRVVLAPSAAVYDAHIGLPADEGMSILVAGDAFKGINL